MRIPLLAAALLLAAVEAHAQTSSSHARIYDSQTLSSPCPQIINSNQPGSSSTNCSLIAMSGGDAASSGSANNAARTINAMASMVQTGPMGSMVGLANGGGTLHSALSLVGAWSASDRLVFHVASTVSRSAVGDPAATPTHAAYSVDFSGIGSGANFLSVLMPSAYGPPLLYGNGYTLTGGGVDLSVTLGYFTGSSTFNLGGYAESYIESAGRTDAVAFTDLSLRLSGIDWLDANNTLIGSATFAGDGTATISAVVATPEPASVVLLATGLFGVLGIARQRTRRDG